MEEHFLGAIQDSGRSLEEWGIGNMFVYISRIVCHPSRKLPLRFFHLLDISGNTNGVGLQLFCRDLERTLHTCHLINEVLKLGPKEMAFSSIKVVSMSSKLLLVQFINSSFVICVWTIV
ncbi:uncharacterized protein [Glycine max]|uniref:uncharacterized protein n=1 Tax=Glycine max TaxID=3847 RepID=UPI001B354A28|nr:uncharacterized protein LOC121174273 [Glycine max]